MRNRILYDWFAACILLCAACSQDNFVPMRFDSPRPAGDAAALDTTWRTYTISSYGMQVCHFLAEPGLSYALEAQTPSWISINVYGKIPVTDDSILINNFSFNQDDVQALFCAAESCKVLIWVFNYNRTPVTYSLRLRTRPLYIASPKGYADTIAGATPGGPIQSEIVGPQFRDTIGFDRPFTKYTYKVPLDSFESVSFAYVEKPETVGRVDALCYLESRRFDTIPGFYSHRFYTSQTYWNSVPDTVLFTAYLDVWGARSRQLASRGLSTEFLPQVFVSVDKKKYAPVSADGFDGAGHGSVLLGADSLYSLTLRSFLETDSFCVKVNADSVYQLAVNSPTGIKDRIAFSSSIAGISYLTFTDKDSLVFRPDQASRYILFCIYSEENVPGPYTVSISPYRGGCAIDSFEQDNVYALGAVLLPRSSQDHTIFPLNENDFFKVNCFDHDTFTIQIDNREQAVSLNSRGFAFGGTGIGINFTDLSLLDHSDSGSVSRYRYCKTLADTVYFYATARQYVEYSISLLR